MSTTRTKKSYLDQAGLETLVAQINTKLDSKVNKDGSKVLSTNDYTTTEKNKLAGIDDGANNYELPVAGTILGGVKSGTDITVDTEGNVSVNDNSHNHTIANVTNLQTTLDGKVPTTRTINSKALSGNITLSAGDVGALASSVTHLSGDVPTTRTVNGKALSSDITLSASDVGADASGAATTALADAKKYTDDAISGVIQFDCTVVESLPATGVKGIIYLIADAHEDTQDIYDEYLWIGDKFEKIGNTDIDLSSYQPKQMSTASRVLVTNSSKNIATSSISTTKLGYLTDVTSNIQAQIDGKVDKVSGKDLSTNDFTDTLKTKVEDGAGLITRDASNNVKGEIFNSYTGEDKNIASGELSHAEGNHTTASASYAHAEGSVTSATGEASHAEGGNTTASNACAHAEGGGSTASGANAHAEGAGTTASGTGAHAEGGGAKALGSYAHAEGNGTTVTASGMAAHAEGNSTTASGSYSHTEGSGTSASNEGAHAEGGGSQASGAYSHAEGIATKATNSGAHAEGSYSEAKAPYSHAEGEYTLASSTSQHVEGKYNIEDAAGTYAHITGNGDGSTRSNAYTLDWDGNAQFAGDVTINAFGDNPVNISDLTQTVTLTQAEYEALENKDPNAIYMITDNDGLTDSINETLDDLDTRVSSNTTAISQLNSELSDRTYTITKYSVLLTANKEYILSCSQAYQLFFVAGQKGIIGTFNDMNGNALQKTIFINGVIDDGNNSAFKIVANGAKYIKITLAGNTGIWICSSSLFSIN